MTTSKKKTVLITGCSTGIGRETVTYFHKEGWNVIATMRSPEKEKELSKLSNTLCCHLDVTDRESITDAINKGLQKFGTIDVVVNNAGYGLTGVFEEITPEQIERQFKTNVYGLMDVTRAILPHMRLRRQGVIINVSSVAGHVSFPLYSPYNSSKWAVEGFSESLQYELNPFGISIKLVEPGPIKTDFYDRSADFTPPTKFADEYAKFTETAINNMNKSGGMGLPPKDVAKVIYRAATDGCKKLRYPVGMQAKTMIFLKRILPMTVLSKIIKQVILRK